MYLHIEIMIVHTVQNVNDNSCNRIMTFYVAQITQNLQVKQAFQIFTVIINDDNNYDFLCSTNHTKSPNQSPIIIVALYNGSIKVVHNTFSTNGWLQLAVQV